jgi:hypothetical protein
VPKTSGRTRGGVIVKENPAVGFNSKSRSILTIQIFSHVKIIEKGAFVCEEGRM